MNYTNKTADNFKGNFSVVELQCVWKQNRHILFYFIIT